MKPHVSLPPSLCLTHTPHKQMIRLVKAHRVDLLLSTHIHLGHQFAAEGSLSLAEQHYLAAREWRTAVNMYKERGLWESALRIVKALVTPPPPPSTTTGAPPTPAQIAAEQAIKDKEAAWKSVCYSFVLAQMAEEKQKAAAGAGAGVGPLRGVGKEHAEAAVEFAIGRFFVCCCVSFCAVF
jgi:hypothetical protein